MTVPSMNFAAKKADWLRRTAEALAETGCVVLENFLSAGEVKETKERLYEVEKKIVAIVGREALDRNENGILRVPMQFDPYFLRFLEIPEVLAIVDATVSETAVLYTQNGIVLPPVKPGDETRVQYKLHADFPRYLAGAMSSVNVMFALDDYSEKTGGTRLAPGTHQKQGLSADALEARAKSVECPAGSAIVFDGTLWHSSGRNVSGKDRCALNHVFCRAYFKQQIDYVRCLGSEFVEKQKPRTQQLLGYFTRIPTRIEEYYLPEDKRLFRRGQG